MGTKVFGQDLGNISKGVGKLFSFWGESMKMVLPKKTQRKLNVGIERLVVFVKKDEIELLEIFGDNEISLGVFTRNADYLDKDLIALIKANLTNDNELYMYAPNDVVLRKKVSFPKVVENNLKQTVFYELDKHTPFKKEDVLYDVLVTNKAAGNVFADLVVVHKSQISGLLDAFNQEKIKFDALSILEQTKINLLPTVLLRKKASIKVNRIWLLTFLLTALIGAVLLTPLYFKRKTSIDLENKVAILNERAQGESQLWDKLEDKDKVVSEFLSSRPVAFSNVYEELAKLLSNETWVSKMDYTGDTASISGESGNATELVELINSSLIFSNAKFNSPIVTSKKTKKEVFKVSFDIVSSKGSEE